MKKIQKSKSKKKTKKIPDEIYINWVNVIKPFY